MAHMSHEESEK
jgi:hypothetical protein